MTNSLGVSMIVSRSTTSQGLQQDQRAYHKLWNAVHDSMEKGV